MVTAVSFTRGQLTLATFLPLLLVTDPEKEGKRIANMTKEAEVNGAKEQVVPSKIATTTT